MGVKILNRQRFHMSEQFYTELFHSSLTDIDHDTVVGPGTQDTDNQYCCQRSQCACQRSIIRIQGLCHWHNIVVDQRLHKQSRTQSCNRRHNDSDGYRQAGAYIIFQDISQQSFQRRQITAVFFL